MANDIRILVIDDNQNWQKKLPEILSRLGNGVHIDVAANYEAALGYINSELYRLATIDLSLVRDPYAPKNSKLLGVELVQAFRQSPNNANCSLIILTGYPMPNQAKQLLRTYRIVEFIDKGEFDNYDFIELAKGAILPKSTVS